MKEHNEIDALFESTFDGLTLTPDSSVKENIDRAIVSKKKRRKFLFILFPVLFGAAGFAAMLYFYDSSEKSIQSSTLFVQNRLPQNKSTLSDSGGTNIRPNETKQIIPKTSAIKPKSDRKQTIEKTHIKTNHSLIKTKSSEQPKSKLTFLANNKSVSSETPILPPNQKEEQKRSLNDTLEKPKNELLAKQDSVLMDQNQPDSTKVSSLSDSTSQIIAEVLKSQGSNKGAGKWSLSLLSYWEGEKKRSPDFIDEPFIEKKKESARIHSSTFYAKLEVNRKLTPQLEVLTGIGFRSSKIVQYGYLIKIETPLDNLGSGGPGGPLPITQPIITYYSGAQSFQVNSIVVPVGLAYSLPIGNKMHTRLSAGGELAYGKLSKKDLQSELSTPRFNPFGCSIWVRPELSYSFGKTELFGFGTFNQFLSQQLKWNFESRRNPAFGGGIGLRIQL